MGGEARKEEERDEMGGEGKARCHFEVLETTFLQFVLNRKGIFGICQRESGDWRVCYLPLPNIPHQLEPAASGNLHQIVPLQLIEDVARGKTHPLGVCRKQSWCVRQPGGGAYFRPSDETGYGKLTYATPGEGCSRRCTFCGPPLGHAMKRL